MPTEHLLLWSLIIVPTAMAFLAWITPGKLRSVLVGFGAVATAGLGLAMGGWLYFAHPHSFELQSTSTLSMLGMGLELAIIVVILAVAIRIRSWAIILLGVAQLALAVTEEVLSHGKPRAEGATFTVDSLSAILILVVSVIGSIIVYYAIGYMKEHAAHAPATAAGNGRFFLYLVGFLGMMNGLVMADDLKWLGFFWEVTTFCSFMLIGHDRTEEACRNAKRALLINSFGGLAMMIAGVIAVANGSAATITAVKNTAAIVPIALLCLAAFTKSAQLPFQSWLLGAMVAPTPVSALLHSATMVKAGSYLVLRLAPAFHGTKFSTLVAIIGAFTFVMTSALACGQRNGKKVLAYSTIANLGLIVMCAGINTPLAYAAALMTLCFHAASKGLLFMCMGTIEQKIHSRDIEEMGGIMYRMPFTTFVALIGMVSMLVPPFGMLLSKWMAMESAIHNPLVLILVIVGAAFTVLFWAKWIGRIQTVSYHEKYTIEKAPLSMLATMGLMAVAVVAAGLGAVPIFNNLIVPQAHAIYASVSGASFASLKQAGNFTMMWPLFVFPAGAILLGIFSYFRFRPEQVRLPFLCGENVENTIPSYTFRSLGDQPETAWAMSYYLRDLFTEGRVTFWCNLIATMAILAMFGVLAPA